MALALYTLYGLLVMGLLASLLYPLLTEESRSSQAGVMLRYRGLVDERERLLQNLADLQQDLQLEKVSASDYDLIRADLLNEVANLMNSIERLEAEEAFFAYVRDLEKAEEAR